MTLDDQLTALGLSDEQKEPITMCVSLSDSVDSVETIGSITRICTANLTLSDFCIDVAQDGEIEAMVSESGLNVTRYLVGDHVGAETAAQRDAATTAFVDAQATKYGTSSAEMRRRLLELAESIIS